METSTKTLKTIQTLSNIGRILCKILFILCIVGFCGCIVGFISLAVGAETVKVGGVTLHSIIENESGMNMQSMYAAIAVGMVFCIAEAVLCKFGERYFKNELADGTPFTLRGAKELMRLGIMTIVIPVATVIISAIGVGIAGSVVPGISKQTFDGDASIGLGVMMIIAALLCRHGAEVSGEKEKE